MPVKKKLDQKEGMLVEAAKAIGSTVGKLAAKAGMASPETRKAKPGRLQKKLRSRKPRLQKKAMKKAAARK
jgi:hypothetical protein